MNFEDALLAGLALLVLLVVLMGAWRLVRKWLRTATGSPPKAIMLVGCFLFLLSGLFPPWLYTHSGHTVRSAGYWFLLTAPKPTQGYYGNDGMRLDAERLAIEWLCVLVGTGMALMLVAKSGRGQGKTPEADGSDKHAATTPPPTTETIEAATIQPTAKPEPPSPPAVKTRRDRWMTLTSLVALAIIGISLVVSVVREPKPNPKTFTFEDATKPKTFSFEEATSSQKPNRAGDDPFADLIPSKRPVAGQKPNQSRRPPKTDKFGGVEVDEFGGVAVDEFDAVKAPSPVRPRASPKKNTFDELDWSPAATAADKRALEEGPWTDYAAGTPSASMKVIEIKGAGLIYFPRDMSAKQIRDAMRRIIGSGFTPLPNATNKWRYSPASNGQ